MALTKDFVAEVREKEKGCATLAVAQPQPVEKVQRKLGFFAFMWYNIGEGS